MHHEQLLITIVDFDCCQNPDHGFSEARVTYQDISNIQNNYAGGCVIFSYIESDGKTFTLHYKAQASYKGCGFRKGPTTWVSLDIPKNMKNYLLVTDIYTFFDCVKNVLLKFDFVLSKTIPGLIDTWFLKQCLQDSKHVPFDLGVKEWWKKYLNDYTFHISLMMQGLLSNNKLRPIDKMEKPEGHLPYVEIEHYYQQFRKINLDKYIENVVQYVRKKQLEFTSEKLNSFLNNK